MCMFAHIYYMLSEKTKKGNALRYIITARQFNQTIFVYRTFSNTTWETLILPHCDNSRRKPYGETFLTLNAKTLMT